MATENQLVEEWLRAARGSVYPPDNAAQFAATMALAEGVKWIGELLAELVQMVKDDDRIVKLLLALAGKQFDRNIAELKEMIKPLPCNEMGGGSAGLDTAGDFAMHCDKPDKHDRPHSYEEKE